MTRKGTTKLLLTVIEFAVLAGEFFFIRHQLNKDEAKAKKAICFERPDGTVEYFEDTGSLENIAQMRAIIYTLTAMAAVVLMSKFFI